LKKNNGRTWGCHAVRDGWAVGYGWRGRASDTPVIAPVVGGISLTDTFLSAYEVNRE